MDSHTIHRVCEKALTEFNLPSIAWRVRNAQITIGSVLGDSGTSCEEDPEDTLWHWGSCAKALTATTVATVVNDGQMSWESTVGGVLGDVVDQIHPECKDITLEQLLQHRAGLPHEIQHPLALPEQAPTARVKMAALGLSEPPEYKPGSRYSYSNFELFDFIFG